jgi:hypothetical protein
LSFEATFFFAALYAEVYLGQAPIIKRKKNVVKGVSINAASNVVAAAVRGGL